MKNFIEIKSLEQRSCGECTACCTLLGIEEIQKPENVKCKHCADSCTIYDTRPTSCKNFMCGWLMGDMDESMRPDKSKVLIEILPSDKIVLALTYDDNEHIPETIINEYLNKNKAVLAKANRTYLPNNMSMIEVNRELVRVASTMGFC